jgi:cytochrome c oxidase subunit 1
VLTNFNTFLKRWFFPTNHKEIGTLYFFFSLITGFIGILSSVYLKLAITGKFAIFTYNPKMFNIILISHVIVTIFFFSMPVLICGFTYMVLPLVLKLERSNIIFSKTSIFSFWLLVFSFLIFLTTLILESYFGDNWEVKIPFFCFFLQSIDLIITSIYCFTISFFLVAINFIIILYNLNLTKMPIFLLTIFVTSHLLLLFLPIFFGITTIYLVDFSLLSVFFNPVIGGDELPWSHLLWFFAHPEIYILVLPSIGIISQIIATLGKKSYYNKKYIVYSIWFIGFLGYFAWVLNFIALNLPVKSYIFISIARIIVIFPIFFIIIHWLYILCCDKK